MKKGDRVLFTKYGGNEIDSKTSDQAILITP